MARKKGEGNQKEEISTEYLRKPWIQIKNGRIVITILSIAMMIFVAANIIIESGDWGRGILYGFLFGGSIWLVFGGMNWFHSLFRPKEKQETGNGEQKTGNE